MKDCCSSDAAAVVATNGVAGAADDDPRRVCAGCGGGSRPVTRKTVLLMLKPERFGELGDGEYRFCSAPDCRVVYFAEGVGAAFMTEDLRVRVGLKEKTDPIPLCYCFGFDEAGARAEIEAAGRCTVPQRISALIKDGMCACAERNPSGACCLGEVNRAIKRLLSEAARETQPA